MVSGFVDGGGRAYGVVQYTSDGGRSWSNDSTIDAAAWGGGPISFSGAHGLMPSTAGATMWRTDTGGLKASAWVEVVPDSQGWHSGDYVWDSDGYAAIAGSSFCNSSDFGASWVCEAAEDASGMDGGVACSAAAPNVPGTMCLTGGGEISPALEGWVHVSRNGGQSWPATRAFTAPWPIRSVLAIDVGGGSPPLLVAGGGNFFSSVGGVYTSADGGLTWALGINLGEEVKACRSVSLAPALPATMRVLCVSAGSTGGSIVSMDVDVGAVEI